VDFALIPEQGQEVALPVCDRPQVVRSFSGKQGLGALIADVLVVIGCNPLQRLVYPDEISATDQLSVISSSRNAYSWTMAPVI